MLYNTGGGGSSGEVNVALMVTNLRAAVAGDNAAPPEVDVVQDSELWLTVNEEGVQGLSAAKQQQVVEELAQMLEQLLCGDSGLTLTCTCRVTLPEEAAARRHRRLQSSNVLIFRARRSLGDGCQSSRRRLEHGPVHGDSLAPALDASMLQAAMAEMAVANPDLDVAVPPEIRAAPVATVTDLAAVVTITQEGTATEAAALIDLGAFQRANGWTSRASSRR